jgi:hypothetical protein
MTLESALLMQALGEYAGGSSISTSEVTQLLSRAGSSAFDFLVDHKFLIGGVAVGLWLFLKTVFE